MMGVVIGTPLLTTAPVRFTRPLVLTHGIARLCAAVARIVEIGQIGVAAPNTAVNVPLESIAEVLLGRTRLAGAGPPAVRRSEC